MPSSIELLSLLPTTFNLSFQALLEVAQYNSVSAGCDFMNSRSMKNNGRIIKVLRCKEGSSEFKIIVKDRNRIRQRIAFKSASQFRFKAKERPTR